MLYLFLVPANRKRRWLDGLQQLKKKERNIMKRWTISRNPGKANAAESNNYGEYTAEGMACTSHYISSAVLVYPSQYA